MLAYVLALAVGLGSAGLYAIAFLLPEIHRKNDIIWSGVGLFYALVLWVCANRISGGVLLGQIASVSLLGWFAWQTLMLRREALPKDQQTALPTQAEIKQLIQQQLDRFSPGQSSGSTDGVGGTIAQLQQGFIGVVDRVTATIEQTIAKFKKAPTPSVQVPPVTPKPPAAETKTATVVETPATPPAAIETPPVETPATPPAAVEPPATQPAAVETPTTPIKSESGSTPVDFVSSPDIETPSVADNLPGQETHFQSPTDEQIDAAIENAESDS